MGAYPSAWRRALARASALGLVAFSCGCNALLGTPDPELAPEGGDAGATRDAPDEGDATAAQDSTTPSDGPMSEAAPDDAPGHDAPPGDAGGVDAPPSGPPSCAADAGPGVTTCGVAGDSCCTSVLVDGGSYYRTYVSGTDGVATSLADPATVSAFRLDRYEVTVGRFRPFVAAAKAGWTPPSGAGIHGYLNGDAGLQEIVDGATVYEPGWSTSWNAATSQADGGGIGSWDGNLTSCGPASTWSPAPADRENLPINCINWYEAYAFCIWDGGFLPSEAEWEYVAAGGTDEREYPWGATDPGLANQYAIFGCDYPDGGQPGVDAAGTCGSVANIAPVGSAASGAAKWTQLDLAGNVREPMLDDYNPVYPSPCTDCAEFVNPGPGRSARGGSWWVQPGAMLSPARFVFTPDFRDFKGGARCARAP
jgi:formylglycine-generating enzyme required for sulfatase activity